MSQLVSLHPLIAVSAFGCGYFLFHAMYQWISDVMRIDAMHKRAGTQGIFAKLFTKKIPGFYALSAVLLRIKGIQEACSEVTSIVSEHHIPTTARRVCALIACVNTALCVIAGCIFSAESAAILFIIIFLVFCGAMAKEKEKRIKLEREEIPEALRTMQTCFQAGLSLEQTFKQLAASVQGPLGQAFENVSHMLSSGQTIYDALAYLNGHSNSDELSFVIASLAVQHQTGGSMESILDAARRGVVSELELKRTLRVQTAQARASYHIILLVTFSLIAVLILLSDDFFEPFVSSVPGFSMLIVAIVLQILGIASIKHLLHKQEV